MVDKEVFENLSISIRGYLQELYAAQDIDWHKFTRDNRSKRFVERVLQILVESMIDLGQHIIASEGFREPDTYRDVFRILCEKGVLPQEKLPVYEKIAAFRNVLVHHYERIDDSIVYAVFSQNLSDIEAFLTYVLTWLDHNSLE